MPAEPDRGRRKIEVVPVILILLEARVPQGYHRWPYSDEG